uniref:Uncharacterized protein n=2 Tax=Brassica oleracea TaxID=3712 RepID=A0A0D3DPN0_BRAOL|nr:unnamed protein product [Brassica oleracea]
MRSSTLSMVSCVLMFFILHHTKDQLPGKCGNDGSSKCVNAMQKKALLPEVGSPSSLTWYQSPIHAAQPDPYRSGLKLAHRSLSEHSEIGAQRAIISRGRIRHKVFHIGSWKGS